MIAILLRHSREHQRRKRAAQRAGPDSSQSDIYLDASGPADPGAPSYRSRAAGYDPGGRDDRHGTDQSASVPVGAVNRLQGAASQPAGAPRGEIEVDPAGSVRLLRTLQEQGGRRYAAALRDADRGSPAGDFVKVDCAACHHVALLTPEALLRVGLSPAAKVLGLEVGAIGDATVLELAEGDFEYRDVLGEVRAARQRLKARGVVLAV